MLIFFVNFNSFFWVFTKHILEKTRLIVDGGSLMTGRNLKREKKKNKVNDSAIFKKGKRN